MGDQQPQVRETQNGGGNAEPKVAGKVPTNSSGKKKPNTTPRLGPLSQFAAAVLFFISSWSMSPPGVSPIILMLMAIVFGVVAHITVSLMTSGRPSTQPQERKRELAETLILFGIVFSFLFMLAVGIPSVFLGFPVDLRHYINPSLVPAKPFPPKETIPLSASWATDSFPVYAPPGSGQDERIRESNTTLAKWIRDGGSKHKPNDKLLILTSNVQTDFFTPFSGRVVFEAAEGKQSGPIERLNACLAEGAAFLLRSDPVSGAVSYRQVSFYIPHENMDRPSGQDSLENNLYDIQFNAGERLCILIRLTARPDESLPASLDSYRASVVPVY